MSCLFGNTLVGVEAVAKVLAVLVACVISEHLAAGGSLEGLEARLALDRLGRGVLVTGSAFNLVNDGVIGSHGRNKVNIRLSADSSPPWDLNHPCDHASAVLYNPRSVYAPVSIRKSLTWLRYPLCRLLVVSY